jgi:hypothetical protein
LKSIGQAAARQAGEPLSAIDIFMRSIHDEIAKLGRMVTSLERRSLSAADRRCRARRSRGTRANSTSLRSGIGYRIQCRERLHYTASGRPHLRSTLVDQETAMLPTPAELREQSRVFRAAARGAATPYLKHRPAGYALSLAMAAEAVERGGQVPDWPRWATRVG